MKKALSAAAVASIILSSCGTVINNEATTPSAILRDGSYSQHQEYSPAPDYTFFIDVNAELQDGKITSMQVIGDPNGQKTLVFAEEFTNTFQSQVIGKTLTEAKDLVRVSGASMTTTAFQNALDAIESQAR